MRSSLVARKECEVCCREAEVNASLGKSKEKGKIEILVPLSLSVSCPGLGDRSLPSFPVARSCQLSKFVS